ncbi:MAG: preprotein translocase subunit SecA [Candidatus Andersenbacteria bacterium]|nr:preprotein translocase subunit SecA [Candidatus Andersenbacteria bacterium]
MALFDIFKSTSRHEKAATALWPRVEEINEMEAKIKKLSDDELRALVQKHRGKTYEELTDALPELFAAIREGGVRTLNLRLFDVQLLGGMMLLKRTITEMKTGEGKTFVATAPLVIRALAGKGAHLVTANDYLASRDAAWMRPLYEFFGFTVGVILPGQTPPEKRTSYAADITYGTNNEFGFDYLRDNMAQRVEDLVQRELYFAIVDEVDSILIDEARTPLIISAPDAESTQLYEQFSRLIPNLKTDTHYNIDEKRRAASLTDEGISTVEKMLNIQNIYEEKGMRFVHHLEQALRAQTLYHRDKDYVVQDGQVIIVDEFTGRMMEGRRYSDGLHQALEAKERVKVQQESRTLASITFQNLFRLYQHLSGMTGTAVTSAEEFEKVYNLEVAVIPTNKKLVRQDKTDRIYMNEGAKYKAVVAEIKERHKKGQPVLVGTIAIEKSEYLSALLSREGVPHQVLNAKHHAREAEIVAQAGQKGAVTISTNMAGRGTDIKLGDGVTNVGGLFILGTERHEARRIDNQLRGRSGRQGDPGETQFFVSMEDDIMRVFGGSKMKSLMERLNVADEAIENRLVSRALEGAQERVEGYYFDMRKQVLSYDDVMNRQRNAIYGLRKSILREATWRNPSAEPVKLSEYVDELVAQQAHELVAVHALGRDAREWNIQEIAEVMHALSGLEVSAGKTKLQAAIEGKGDDEENARVNLQEAITVSLEERLAAKENESGEAAFGELLKAAAMRAIDVHWMDHLDTMDYLRTGIGLRGYGQRDPLVEYQKEGHQLFQKLMGTINATFLETVFKAQMVKQEAIQGEAIHPSASAPKAVNGSSTNQPAAATGDQKTLKNPYKDVGRNDPCPCGSGKKFKKCGMINAPEHRG